MGVVGVRLSGGGRVVALRVEEEVVLVVVLLWEVVLVRSGPWTLVPRGRKTMRMSSCSVRNQGMAAPICERGLGPAE